MMEAVIQKGITQSAITQSAITQSAMTQSDGIQSSRASLNKSWNSKHLRQRRAIIISSIIVLSILIFLLALVFLFTTFSRSQTAGADTRDNSQNVNSQGAIAVNPATIVQPSAENVQVTTPQYHPNHEIFNPPLGRYTYTVGWQGIPAAEATLDVAKVGSRYQLVSTARTYSAIDIFYTMRYRAEGLISSQSFLPIKTSILHQENSRVKTTEIQFAPDGHIHAVRSQAGKEPVVLDFNPNNWTLDPFSAAFLARSLEWKIGDKKSFDTFNGKSRYLITLENTGMEKVNYDDTERDCWIIVPTVKNLVNPEQSKKLREAKIYVTADNAREVLKIASSVFIGTVTTKLENFFPLKTSAMNETFAKNRSSSAVQ